jgi:hypothetical protein
MLRVLISRLARKSKLCCQAQSKTKVKNLQINYQPNTLIIFPKRSEMKNEPSKWRTKSFAETTGEAMELRSMYRIISPVNRFASANPYFTFNRWIAANRE